MSECRPPEGTRDDTWHWIDYGSSHQQLCACWRKGSWSIAGSLHLLSPSEVARFKWRYSHPASPTDAAELAVLWERVARLEKVLETIDEETIQPNISRIARAALQSAQTEGGE